MSNLVIVESPAKGKTIEKFLGKDFQVRASFGHIRDLLKKELSVDIDNDFAPTYEIPTDKKKHVTELKSLVKKAEKVWIATDEDREWEAIGWHLCEALGIDSKSVSRIVFHEITKKAIDEAIKHPRHIDLDLVNAQQSRRILDRLVWYQLSPVLWKKIRKWLSAGRVQSVAVKLIVEREREILAFKPEEAWRVRAYVVAKGIRFPIEFLKSAGKNKKLKSLDDVEKLFATLGLSLDGVKPKTDKKGNQSMELTVPLAFLLKDIVTKDSQRSPGAPFTTSTLQQEASRKLGFGVSLTMSIAQALYQNGVITYMRTDSVNLSDFAIDACKTYIDTTFGKEYSIAWGRKFKTKQANAQEAHEAIRPTDISKTPDTCGLEGNDLRLYKLIWERTVASQMKEALVETTTYDFEPVVNQTQSWVAKGEVIKFAGFMKLYVEGSDEESEEGENAELPALEKGDKVTTESLHALQSFSRPPARYTEAALVKKLESEGIGRPSTYAPTISTIIERGYVEKKEKRLHPTDIAFVVVDYLEANFKDLMDYQFTANIEQELDSIAQGKLGWVEMLTTFHKGFKEELKKTALTTEKVREKLGKKCPKCETGELVYKYSKGGKFIWCDRYPECDFLENIVEPGQNEYLEKLKKEHEGKPCPAGGTIVVKTWRFGPFLASSLYPEVKWIGKVPDAKLDGLESKFGGETCDKCGEGIMHVKGSRRGPFLACSRYPECKNAKNLPKDAKQSLDVESSEQQS